MSETWLQYLKKNSSIFLENFEFLEQLGFELADSVEASGNNSRYDGFHFEWRGKTKIIVSYYEQEVSIVFSHGNASASYWYIWGTILKKEQRFCGAMFSGNNIEKAITIIANDIKNDFLAILNGDDELWNLISEEKEKDAKEQEKKIKEALVDVPKLIKPTCIEALDRINNKGLEGLRKKFAPKNNILQISKKGIIESMYTFKKQPTSFQEHAAFKENPGTVQINVGEDTYATVEELTKRVEDAWLVI